MNTLIISIGSNENSEENISACREMLCSVFQEICFSDTSMTKPFGKQYKNDFMNQLAFVCTNSEQNEVRTLLKEMEKKLGRATIDKAKGVVKIDIDLVKWNETIVKPDDWQRNYVADLLPSLYEHLR